MFIIVSVGIFSGLLPIFVRLLVRRIPIVTSRVDATPTCRTGATQVVEVELPKLVGEGSSTIPPRLGGSGSLAEPTNEIHGRGFPPSKPSPKEKNLEDISDAEWQKRIAEQKRRLFERNDVKDLDGLRKLTA